MATTTDLTCFSICFLLQSLCRPITIVTPGGGGGVATHFLLPENSEDFNVFIKHKRTPNMSSGREMFLKTSYKVAVDNWHNKQDDSGCHLANFW